MKKNKLFIWIISISFITSCTTGKAPLCKDKERYIKKVNTSKSYWIEGTYCIAEVNPSDTITSEIYFDVYERITGKPINEGTIFFDNSLKVQISLGKAKAFVDSGTYNIGITNLNSLPFSIKGLKLNSNMIYKINVYLGSSLQN
jgi:hypothetical protein